MSIDQADVSVHGDNSSVDAAVVRQNGIDARVSELEGKLRDLESVEFVPYEELTDLARTVDAMFRVFRDDLRLLDGEVRRLKDRIRKEID